MGLVLLLLLFCIMLLFWYLHIHLPLFMLVILFSIRQESWFIPWGCQGCSLWPPLSPRCRCCPHLTLDLKTHLTPPLPPLIDALLIPHGDLTPHLMPPWSTASQCGHLPYLCWDLSCVKRRPFPVLFCLTCQWLFSEFLGRKKGVLLVLKFKFTFFIWS